MKFSQTKRIIVFGRKIASVEVTSEFEEATGSPERRKGGGGLLPMNPDFLTPILAEAIKRANGKMRNRFKFEGGNELEVQGNIDSYVAVQALKERFTRPEGAAKVVFGFSALTDAYTQEGLGASGVFMNHIHDIIKENWETVEPPSS